MPAIIFTNAPIMNYINARGRGYVGDLKFNRKIWVGGREIHADEYARTIPPEDRKRVTEGKRNQWYFTKTIRFPEVDHPVRIVILWDRKNGAEPAKIMVTNRTSSCWRTACSCPRCGRAARANGLTAC